MIITYFECAFVVLVIQRAKRSAVLYRHLSSVLFFHVFLYYLTNDTIFRKALLNIQLVFLFSLQILCEIFSILRRIERNISTHVLRSSSKVPVFLVGF